MSHTLSCLLKQGQKAPFDSQSTFLLQKLIQFISTLFLANTSQSDNRTGTALRKQGGCGAARNTRPAGSWL